MEIKVTTPRQQAHGRTALGTTVGASQLKSPEFHFLSVYEKSVFILLSAIVVLPAARIPF